MIYEIVNPSDAYSLDSDDFEAACYACLAVGGGCYALEPEDRDAERMPLFLFGGAEEWWQGRFGYPLDEAFGRIGSTRIADALESILIGDADNRRDYVEAVALIDDPAKRKRFRDQRHDRARSSMNDIGGRAYAMAARLRGAT